MTAVTAFPQLFISYSRVDSAFVDRLEQDLAVRDVPMWVDRRKLEGSQIWAAEIQKGIDQAEIVLVIVSPEAMASEWVQREISYALGKHKPIIPLFWRSADVPITIYDLQALLFEGSYDDGLRELLVTLTKIPTMPAPIPHAAPSIATMDAPAPAVRLVQPVAPPPAPDADLNNLFTAAIAAEASSDIERALLFFEQITARNPHFGNGLAARKATEMVPRVRKQRIQRLRERARVATTANEWHGAAGAWDALLAIAPDDPEASDGVHDALLHITKAAADQGDWGEALGACAAILERFSCDQTAIDAQQMLRQNYDAAWLYDNARGLADAGDASSARAMLGVLWQQASHFGDPSGVARGLGLTVTTFPSLRELVISFYIAETRAIMSDPTRKSELLLATLHEHSSYVWSVAWSPDGTRIASGSGGNDNTVRVWEVSTGKELATFRGRGYMQSVAWSPDGTRIASGGYDQRVPAEWPSSGDEQTVRVWEVSTGKEPATLRECNSFVYSVAWSPDGTRLASGCDDGTIRIWRA